MHTLAARVTAFRASPCRSRTRHALKAPARWLHYDGRESARKRSAMEPAAAATASAASDAATTTPTLRAELEALFAEALRTAFPAAVSALNVTPAIALCGNPAFGDYQCNNAMPLFQRLKASPPPGTTAPASPRAIAEALIKALPPSPVIASTSIAGPGFINISLSRSYLADRLVGLLRHGAKCWAPRVPGGSKQCIVDFSSPNIAKEMHVGHLRSTILGETLSCCLEYAGAKVLRLNHVGDWGTQFGMLIEHLNDQPGGSDGASIGDLQAFYKASKKRFDEDAEFKLRAQAAVVRLQAGEGPERDAWRRICDVSRQEFDAIYKRLDVKNLVERGESFYNEFIPARLEELAEKGVSTMSDGAQCVFTPGNQTPLIVRKSDGGFNYASTDLAAIWHRVHKERADWVIYVTDAGQAGHFVQVFATAKTMGWIPEAVRVDHVGFGLVLGDDGKRFRTRSSEVVRLVDLLDEAVTRCAAQLKERNPEWSDAEIQDAAEAMGYGAVKYADLNQNRNTNYTFSFDRMLSLQGNTAVYLLYAHARICSIVRKSGVDEKLLGPEAKDIQLATPEEAALALTIARFPEAVEAVLEELMPNRLTDYLYDLSTKFNDFYTNCPVIGSDEQASRLQLCEATAVVMRQCFTLLGIRPLMRL